MHILLVEDSPTDAELIERALRRNGLEFTCECVQSQDAFVNALKRHAPDIVLSDYNLPGFSGRAALEILDRYHPEIPLILVTGALPDHEAVEMLQSGAQDYVLKDRLARLAPAVRHALLVRQWNNSKQLAEAQLHEKSELLENIVNSSTDHIVVKDRQLRVVLCNESYAYALGKTPEEMRGKSDVENGWSVALVKGDSEKGVRGFERDDLEALEGKVVRSTTDLGKTGNGIGILDCVRVPLKSSQGEIFGILCVSRDITEQKLIEQQIRIAATAFETQAGMVVTDEKNTILRVNSAFTDITGYSAEEAVGRDPSLLASGRHSAEFYNKMWKRIRDTGSWEGEIWNRRKSGEVYPEHLAITAVKDPDGVVTHYVGSFNDITLTKAAEDKIKHLAFYDPLTRLPNRRLLLDRLNKLLASNERSGRKGALLFVDLDNFKTLNDTLGHDMGDLLLQQVAHRLESCVRESDTVARLGGDEFVVMLDELSPLSLESAEQAEVVGENILAIFNQSYQLGTHEFHITPSIGATLFNGQHQSVDELLKQADIAMYQAKKAGRNTLRFFDPEMQESINARAALETGLRKALEGCQFQLHYQVQSGIRDDGSHRMLGAEALIRWAHPERGIVLPMEFIPLAEETGIIVSIGQWVLDAACAQLDAWQRNALTRDLVMAVNVSARQFRHPDFVHHVKAAVQRHSIDPGRLKLELTESLLLENVGETISTMNALNEIGIQFSLDDFGTGYSSLQYLKQLPLDQIKIDQSFVRDIVVDPNDRAIVHTIIAMARSLDIHVIAEGVETEEQLELLLDKGCYDFQGYLFGRPVPSNQFEKSLNDIDIRRRVVKQLA